MAKFNYPFREADIKFGSNVAFNLMIIILVVGCCIIYGVIYFIVEMVKYASSKRKTNKINAR